jgi:ornithine cyclodeaminase
MTLRYLREEVTRALVSHDLAVEATSAAYMAAANGEGRTFPVVRGHGSDADNRFSIKAASTPQLAGLKIGSYWPVGTRPDEPRHSSCILLFDKRSGRIETLIEAREANGYRTSAGNAIAVDRLARDDAEHLAVFGAGHQAQFECEAVMRVRRIRTVYIVNRSAEHAQRFAERLQNRVETVLVSAREACEKSDIVVTVTAARAPLFSAEWVKPGTHISCMGADAEGKQEVPAELLLRSDLYCDLTAQSITIGEFQHVRREVERGVVAVTNMGDVLMGRAPGRRDRHAITVFDSSGLALQDLHLAHLLLREATARGLLQPVEEGAR